MNCISDRNQSQTRSEWRDAGTLIRVLGDQICDNLLFVHALLGCDMYTTSRVFGIGKPEALKKLRSNAFFREKSDVFQDPHATPEDICIAGENALVCLYNGRRGDKIDTALRCSISTAKCHPARHVCNRGHCHQHQPQPSTTVYV